METKICECCGRELPPENFSKRFYSYRTMCKECAHIYDKAKKDQPGDPEHKFILKTLVSLVEDTGVISANQAFDRYKILFPEEAKKLDPCDDDEDNSGEGARVDPLTVTTPEEHQLEANAKVSKRRLVNIIIGQFRQNMDYIFQLWYDGKPEEVKGVSKSLAYKLFDLFDKAYNTKEEAVQEFGQQITELRHANKALFDENGRLAEENKSLKEDLKKRYKGETKAVCDIKSFTPEQLMSELYMRGYRGEIEFEVREIKKCKLGAGLH